MKIEILLNELYNYSLHGIKLGLENIKNICDAMGNPEKNYKVIHIAGTNGKGSTSTVIEQGLIENGKKVGKYTSPHILKFNERISVNGNNITDEEIVIYYEYVKKIVQNLNITPTFFEITTAIMFKYFSDKKIEYAIIEVGLGGKYDATNVVDADISVITNVSLDHTEFLGTTIYQIACEKAGIIKKKSKVIVGSSNSDFLKAIESKTEKYIDVTKKYENCSYKLDFDRFKTIINIDENTYIHSLFGDYQYNNFLCSFEVLRTLGVPKKTIKKALDKVEWKGRFEISKYEDKILILDGAHNIAGINSLCKTLEKGFKQSEIVAIVSILKDKNYNMMIQMLEKYVDKIIFTSLSDIKRGQSAKELYNNTINKDKKLYKESLIEAFEEAKNHTGKVILICGSFYLLSRFKEEVMNDKN